MSENTPTHSENIHFSYKMYTSHTNILLTAKWFHVTKNGHLVRLIRPFFEKMYKEMTVNARSCNISHAVTAPRDTIEI